MKRPIRDDVRRMADALDAVVALCDELEAEASRQRLLNEHGDVAGRQARRRANTLADAASRFRAAITDALGGES